MKEFSLRPKSEFLNTAEWQHIYRLTEQWKSDLLFLADELHFAENLLGKYFLSFSKDENENEIHQILNKLKSAEKIQIELTSKINKHLHNIEELIEFSNSHDAQVFRKEHAVLEEELEEFSDKFRLVKSELFEITENMLEEDKFRHLLSK